MPPGSRRVRIGLILPGDSHLDDELWALALPGVVPCVTRTRGASDRMMGLFPIDEVTALAESPDLEDAADRLRAAHPAALAYVDTSISFVRGPRGADEIIERLRRVSGCPTTVTSTALVEALRALGIRRISAVAPYPDELNALLPAFLAPYGIEVVNLVKFHRNYGDGATSEELATVDPREILEAAKSSDRGTAEAVFVSCTALRSIGAIDLVEQELGKPMLSAVHVTMWHAQRLAGVAGAIAGGGALFERA
jgi:maleate isomerase